MRLIKYTKKGSTKRIDENGNLTFPVYDCRIKVDDENKIITWIDCDCWNFQNKRITKIGRVQDIRFVAEPCKHLLPLTNALKLQGYKFKENSINEGLDKLTPKLRKQILSNWGNKCSYSGCEETENLEIHRFGPGVNGGKYSLLNCKPLCQKHHQMITYQRYRDLK